MNIIKTLTCSLLVSTLLLTVSCTGCSGNTKIETEKYERRAPAFSADSAYGYVAAQCAFGPRVIETEAHAACADWIASKFESLGAKVMVQDGTSKLYDGREIRLRNIIASYLPDATVRVIVCAHWDSRPWADNDQDASHHHTPSTVRTTVEAEWP